MALPLLVKPQVTNIGSGALVQSQLLISMGFNKGPVTLSTRSSFCLSQLGSTSLVLPWQCRPGLEWGSPSRALLWEAGVHPALGPPSGAMTIEAVFPLLLQAFPKWAWHIWKTLGMIASMIKECWCSCNTSSINQWKQGNLCFIFKTLCFSCKIVDKFGIEIPYRRVVYSLIIQITLFFLTCFFFIYISIVLSHTLSAT